MLSHPKHARLPARLVWTRFGVTDRTLDRWLANEALKFPRPLVINHRRYFVLEEIEEWERAQAAKSSNRKATRGTEGRA
jgi:predicted DNA-binding transcriptional regulator AlpA